MNKHLTKDGREFIIRKPNEGDAERLIVYSKLVFASTDQLLTTVDEYTITVDAEKTWIKNMTQNPNCIVLVAELGDQIVGMLFFAGQTKKKNAHTGEFGINVHPDYQSLGIGHALMKNLIDWAHNHSQLEKIFLQVFASNTKAVKLYKDLGFMEEGRHVKAIKQPNGEYIDVIQMYVMTK